MVGFSCFGYVALALLVWSNLNQTGGQPYSDTFPNGECSLPTNNDFKHLIAVPRGTRRQQDVIESAKAAPKQHSLSVCILQSLWFVS